MGVADDYWASRERYLNGVLFRLILITGMKI
jgi:hypothetical protein